MKILQNIQLLPYNSFRTKAVAKLFAAPETTAELSDILNSYNDNEILIIGKGNDLFFTKDFEGLVIKPEIKGIQVLNETTDHVDIEAGAAEDWDGFVQFCVEKGYSGIENLSLIPGTVGASPVQNIGAYGAEVGNVISVVHTLDKETGAPKIFNNAECGFGYRNSVFKQTCKYVITSVVFRLEKSFKYIEKYADLNHELQNNPTPDLDQVREAVIRIRQRKLPDPATLPNAGSFFKNPVLSEDEKMALLRILPEAPMFVVGDQKYKTSAAFLIDKAGLKGKRDGMVGIYQGHSLVIVNYGTENGLDIVRFMNGVQKSVYDLFGVRLEPEVWIY
ncbi:MAG: UDP-N-acetylmuramate dehydrogenase [Dysgonamonadaceae bacterium]